MDTINAEETTSLIPNHDASTAVRDDRRSYQEQLVTHIILTCILFQSIAYYSLEVNIVPTLKESNGTLNWKSANASAAMYIFQGTKS